MGVHKLNDILKSSLLDETMSGEAMTQRCKWR